jgi:hypothetical protein
MPTTLVSTGVEFPDLTVQTTAAVGGGGYALQNYVSPATWTKPAGLKAVKVTVVGAGGNGGAGVTVQPAGLASGDGGGGGGGGAAIEYIPAPSIPGPVVVTAGPGTNSFGPFCSATAGTVGGSTSNIQNAGGAGGSGSGGNINITGQTGLPAELGNGAGGNAALGFGVGGAGVPTSGPAGVTPGNAGLNYGGGGGGGSTGPGSPTPITAPGGTGAPGIVIVEEFY